MDRESLIRSDSHANLRWMKIALDNYHDHYGAYPPAVVRDADGQAVHSWRALLLPFMPFNYAQEIREAYDFSQPWDSSENMHVAWEVDTDTSFFTAPYSSEPYTTIVAVVGDETLWPDTGSRTIDDVTDGAENTIALVLLKRTDILWSEPRDITLAEFVEIFQGLEGRDRRTKQLNAIVFVEGRVVLDASELSLTSEDLRALATVGGGD